MPAQRGSHGQGEGGTSHPCRYPAGALLSPSSTTGSSTVGHSRSYGTHSGQSTDRRECHLPDSEDSEVGHSRSHRVLRVAEHSASIRAAVHRAGGLAAWARARPARRSPAVGAASCSRALAAASPPQTWPSPLAAADDAAAAAAAAWRRQGGRRRQGWWRRQGGKRRRQRASPSMPRTERGAVGRPLHLWGRLP